MNIILDKLMFVTCILVLDLVITISLYFILYAYL